MKKSLKRHINSVHENNRPFQCTKCESNFTENGALLRHIRKVHDKNFLPVPKKPKISYEERKRHTCSFCGKLFLHTGHLREHENAHTGERPFGCEFCDKKFSASSTARNHKKNCEKKRQREETEEKRNESK